MTPEDKANGQRKEDQEARMVLGVTKREGGGRFSSGCSRALSRSAVGIRGWLLRCSLGSGKRGLSVPSLPRTRLVPKRMIMTIPKISSSRGEQPMPIGYFFLFPLF